MPKANSSLANLSPWRMFLTQQPSREVVVVQVSVSADHCFRQTLTRHDHVAPCSNHIAEGCYEVGVKYPALSVVRGGCLYCVLGHNYSMVDPSGSSHY